MSPLFENAIDSVQTGMQFFRDGKQKFAILLIFHSIELFLKELLHRQNPVLIYRNIDKKITNESPTVGLSEALVRFQNVGVSLTMDEQKTLKSLQRRRNRIEHHRYEPDDEDRETLGQSLRFINTFIALHLRDKLANHVDQQLLREIDSIILSYEERLSIANAELEEWIRQEYPNDDTAGWRSPESFKGTVDCPLCSQTLLVLNEPRRGNYCFFCQKEVNAVECGDCGRTFLPETDNDILCDYCPGHAW